MNMNDLTMLEATERYLLGQMSPQEKQRFDDLRSKHAELDEFVVEHHAFQTQFDRFAQTRQLKQSLHRIHTELLLKNAISEPNTAAKVVSLKHYWSRYKRTIAVAASIAGITALTISAATQLFTPKNNQSELLFLKRQVNLLANTQAAQNKKIDRLAEAKGVHGTQLAGGTGFLIDTDGYLVTNNHVVNGANTVVVSNKSAEYIAKTVYTDEKNDLAILKIEDSDWKKAGNLPYAISRQSANLGDELFTLGYPRNSIVYNRGYLSATTGYNDDSLSIQLSISANPGNSGGPVLDKNGNVVGILSTRDIQADGVVYATKSSNIQQAVEKMKTDTLFNDLQNPSRISLIKKLDRAEQIKRIQDCVFMVKVF